MGLNIEISFNLKLVIFLDVTLNLSNNNYKPFSKSNAIPTYINVISNHPASIVKQIPNTINIIFNRLYHLLKTYLIIIRNLVMKLYTIVVIKMNLHI